MLTGLVIGLVVGLGAGLGVGWFAFRRPAGTAIAEPVQAAPASEPEPPAGQPEAEASDDEVRRTLDATRGLLDDLESRYRDGRPRDTEEGEAQPSAPRRRRPRKPEA